MVLFPPLHVVRPLGFAPESTLEDLGLPPVRARCGGGAVAWVAGVWQHQVLSGLVARAAGNIVL